MNAYELDVLRTIKENKNATQRELADLCDYSLGMINKSIASLVEQGLIKEDYSLTKKANDLFDTCKPQNAIILAAGFGLRMLPINYDVPKGMLEVFGEPLIERLICQLKDVGIDDITVVTGYLKESYEHLIDKYNVELVNNWDFEHKNNLYSLGKVVDKISNTYIIPCDVWCEENLFSDNELYSWYAVTESMSDESTVHLNRKRELVLLSDNKDGNAMVGISYITEEDSAFLKNRIIEMIESDNHREDYWELALAEGNKLRIAGRLISSKKVIEINSYEQLRELDYNSRNLTTSILSDIAEKLKCDVGDIKDIDCMKKGLSNRSFSFSCKGEKYVMRIPGVGSDFLMNRRQEYDVYQQIGPLGIGDPVIWFDPDKGYKLTKFIENHRIADEKNIEDAKKCMKALRELNSHKLEVNHTFDIFEKLEFYEKCRDGVKSIYSDYDLTKSHILELKEFVDKQPIELQLSHVDSAAENFLFVKQPDGTEKTVIIDWEYAAMVDPDVNLASWALYAEYDKDKTDWIIDQYYIDGCDIARRIKIYCYIACSGLAWSNWCEFKRLHGIDYGEYALNQYRFAKKYYKIAKDAMKEAGYEL